jgi:hypothetical protein
MRMRQLRLPLPYSPCCLRLELGWKRPPGGGSFLLLSVLANNLVEVPAIKTAELCCLAVTTRNITCFQVVLPSRLSLFPLLHLHSTASSRVLRWVPAVLSFVSLSTRSPVPPNVCVTIPYSLNHAQLRGHSPTRSGSKRRFFSPQSPTVRRSWASGLARSAAQVLAVSFGSRSGAPYGQTPSQRE